jgi:DNA-binding NarL/FixJ family response regulator
MRADSARRVSRVRAFPYCIDTSPRRLLEAGIGEPNPPQLALAVGARVPARILIVDDHFAARTTIRSLLDWHSFQVCGDAKDGQEAIEKVIELKPDIVLLDINMPVMDGVTAAREIRRISPATKIVFLTIHDSPTVIQRTRLWAHGFVPKSVAGTELIPTLNRIVGAISGNPPSAPSKPRRTPTH